MMQFLRSSASMRQKLCLSKRLLQSSVKNLLPTAIQTAPLPSHVQDKLSTIPTLEYIQPAEETLKLSWSDGIQSSFHYVWLRDNCNCSKCRHPIAEERMHDTLSIDLDISPTQVTAVPASDINEASVHVEWPDAHVSQYSASFLQKNCYHRLSEASDINNQVLWRASDMESNMPRIDYQKLNEENGAVEWLELLDTYGFTLIENVPSDEEQCQRVAERIALVRNTFWGPTWSVKSEPKPMNLSMTSEELQPHTDFGWSEAPPGLQFLHCMAFQSQDKLGGESTLVDGFAIAEQLRNEHPESFKLLSTTMINHCFSSKDQWFEYRAPILSCDPLTGQVRDIRFNQANRSPLRLHPDLVKPYYEAMQRWTQATRDPDNLFRFRLREGDMLVFNNRRLLHGRTAYNASTTLRHLKGCYLDAEDYKSKLSMLRKGSQRRFYSRYTRPTAEEQGHRHLDPGFDNFSPTFVSDALESLKDVVASGENYSDGSSLQQVVNAGTAHFRNLNEGTKADYVYQCSLYDHDIKTNLVPRLQGMLEKLEGDHIRLGTGAKVDLFEHSIQCATLAYEDGADEELVVCALLHDVGELLSPCNHGEIAGAILRPYISPERYWILAHHEIFQGYYYFHHVGGNRNTREMFASHPQYQDTIDFCHKYDQAAFDPMYESYSLDFFKPMMQRVLSRKAYWFQPDHPKLGCVTGKSLE
ncbi:gamma-butyrobetaine dioxygenase [Thraustotheca clavata]|uniref:Gamma-butyrobetaine dioxygenase n=1 Tax=Thraustotheca clavata TaxID=74557 RepID=A0A1V9Y8K5_9STRA|nr:gamma-butyrobetaine dioxygenase [Thraustotheca clavata]